ncbi:hypothetical protein CPSG_08893 [Coccidioides posadasii str. Silveira]|uniref:Uncharacterized protein n=1 Tax=Coccidioides posadasii (strain RMSCC 757 / Silveira) TaxID=443226 RepID=E9DGE4_COCPS|nr:hypothetical protein CPSG_08893 [Coccidioides posadasii str. Silveira]
MQGHHKRLIRHPPHVEYNVWPGFREYLLVWPDSLMICMTCTSGQFQWYIGIFNGVSSTC